MKINNRVLLIQFLLALALGVSVWLWVPHALDDLMLPNLRIQEGLGNAVLLWTLSFFGLSVVGLALCRRQDLRKPLVQSAWLLAHALAILILGWVALLGALVLDALVLARQRGA